MFKKIFIGVALAASFNIFPFYALADHNTAHTIQQLQDQINALLIQIKNLQQQSSTEFCHTFSTNLGIGSTGNEVDALVIALGKEGLLEAEKTGLAFNEEIASEVVGFQEKYRSEILTPNHLAHGTGFVGRSTRAKLNALYGCGNLTPPPPIISGPTPTPLPVPLTAVLGDANLDGSVTSADALTIRRYIDGTSSLTGQAFINADVDGGGVTLSDVTLISNYAGCITSVFPLGNGGPRPQCTPSINVVSPNGGESYVSGQGFISIQYNSVNITGQPIVAYLQHSTLGTVRTTIPSIANSSGTIIMGLIIAGADPTGQYKIKLCTPEEKAGICASSANYFTLTAPTITQPSVIPTITISSTSLRSGDTAAISWNTSYTGNTSFYYEGTSGQMSTLIRTVTAGAGDFSWVVPAGITGSWRIRGGNNYDGNFYSAPFTIVAPPPPIVISPSISMTSPAANIQLTTGSSVTVQWAVNDMPSTATFVISLINTSTAAETNLVSSISSSERSRSVTIPASLLPGNYYLSVSCGFSSCAVSDQKLISVVAAPVPPAPSTLLGDANMDGNITSGDALAASNLLTGQAFINADVTGDGRVNGIDSLLISQRAAGLISTFPKVDGSILVLGDANRDGKITSGDSLTVNIYIGGSTSVLLGRALDNADVDDDGKITSNDVKLINNYAACFPGNFPRGSTTAITSCTATTP